MEEILIEEYNYPLPDERIAKYPLAARDQSKLLVYRDGQVSEDRFCCVGEYLPAGSLLIYNNTRVIQARLEFHKTTSNHPTPPQGARIEIFCLEPMEPHDYQLALGSTEGCTWKCMIGNAKKWKSGALSLPVTLPSGEQVTLFAEKGEQTGNTFAVRFWWDTPASHLSPLASNLNISFAEILDAVGELPIPPYLNRKTEESDKTTYQTVYSRIKGSVAAPTAGLHFTTPLIEQMRGRGFDFAEVTLHVGAGTFLPVKDEDATKHAMHTEHFEVTLTTLRRLRQKWGNIVAVGTTSVRTLESLTALAWRIKGGLSYNDTAVGQWELYDIPAEFTGGEALDILIAYAEEQGVESLKAATEIMITPLGYNYRIVRNIVTNFHQPKSTLLLLVSAYVGEDWHRIYDYALSNDFRFLSYGDSSLLIR